MLTGWDSSEWRGGSGSVLTVARALPPRAIVIPVRTADLPEPLLPTRKLIWGPKLTVQCRWH